MEMIPVLPVVCSDGNCRSHKEKVNKFWDTHNATTYCQNCSFDEEFSKRKKVYKVYRCRHRGRKLHAEDKGYKSTNVSGIEGRKFLMLYVVFDMFATTIYLFIICVKFVICFVLFLCFCCFLNIL